MNLQNLRPRRDRGVINGIFLRAGLPGDARPPAASRRCSVECGAVRGSGSWRRIDAGDAERRSQSRHAPEIKPSVLCRGVCRRDGSRAAAGVARTRSDAHRTRSVRRLGFGRCECGRDGPSGRRIGGTDQFSGLVHRCRASLFRALGQNGGGTPRPANWNAIDPSYPKLPIGLLVPPASTRTRHLFDVLIMQAGCERAATPRMPFEQKSRIGFCGALRTDIQVAERQGGAADVINWARPRRRRDRSPSCRSRNCASSTAGWCRCCLMARCPLRPTSKADAIPLPRRSS